MICKKCNHEIIVASNYCPYCGANLTEQKNDEVVSDSFYDEEALNLKNENDNVKDNTIIEEEKVNETSYSTNNNYKSYTFNSIKRSSSSDNDNTNTTSNNARTNTTNNYKSNDYTNKNHSFKNQVNQEQEQSIAIGLIAIILSFIGFCIGPILGVVGLFTYKTKCTGKTLSIIAIIIYFAYLLLVGGLVAISYLLLP